jgi:predicted nuclease of predicted toxin-antitoxin system
MEDDQIIEQAYADNRILITNDKDFGEKIHRERRLHRGIIFLRLADERAVKKIEILGRLLEGYSDRLADQFAVVTETRVRFART